MGGLTFHCSYHYFKGSWTYRLYTNYSNRSLFHFGCQQIVFSSSHYVQTMLDNMWTFSRMVCVLHPPSIPGFRPLIKIIYRTDNGCLHHNSSTAYMYVNTSRAKTCPKQKGNIFPRQKVHKYLYTCNLFSNKRRYDDETDLPQKGILLLRVNFVLPFFWFLFVCLLFLTCVWIYLNLNM